MDDRMTVVAIGAHPDDIELGPGMRLSYHAQRGDRVIGIICSDGEQGGDKDTRIEEAKKAAESLGIKDLHFLHYPDSRLYENFTALKTDIENIILKEKPAVAYLHFPEDRHQDHETASRTSAIACRNVANIFFYKSPSTILSSFQPHIFHVGLQDDFMKKRHALECYKSQISTGRINLEHVEIDLKYYCISARHSPAYTYAEPFCANHIILNLGGRVCEP